MRLGILGGTFNPIHNGHLILAEECLKMLGLDNVYFVPTYIPPHKDLEDNVSGDHRLNMLKLALEGSDQFLISDFELRKKGRSYSIDTIKWFKEQFTEQTEIYFITGSDSLESLDEWKDIDQILALTRFVVASRPGWDFTDDRNEQITKITIPCIDVSSTELRSKIKHGEDVSGFIPDKVLKYIKEKELYIR